ncbi:MAG: hypothetical protein ACXAE3_13785 [Candidatus Kariarchaeaceae archaeon]|jgi:hypothetical protein
MIITVSGLGVSKDEFANLVTLLVGESQNINYIKWQIDKGPQSLVDLLDTRDGKKVIVNVAEQLVDLLQKAAADHQKVTIISQREGSRIIEEALSMVKGLENLQVSLKHIMLAPDIEGSDWSSVGKYATAAAVAGLAGLALAATRNKKGLATAMLGIIGSAVIANKETVSDRLNVESSEESPKFVNMDRHIFINPEHEHYDQISKVMHNAKFYKGVHDPDKISSLDPLDVDLVYRYQKWRKAQEKSMENILLDLMN